ncbi:endonuclease NucS [Schaalia sp. lx-260]|uniref:endonuclease NucS n=1 Tax=Schaalia sp. lx-260 TaxID=2899082 RepID=UPI001E45E909|nr:endonuclease NucS [Schaalia sp. lx-260]
MRILIATCTVDYSGRLSAHLDPAPRVIMWKADGSVLIHSDGGSYKPLNWMTAPCDLTITLLNPEEEADRATQIWTVQAAKTDDRLDIRIYEIFSDVSHELGIDPGLVKDGVESHLQALLSEQIPQLLGKGWELVRREYPTPVGPVDLMVRDPQGLPVAIEVKRRGGIEGVEQLTRYLHLLSRDPLLEGLRGIYAGQEISRQARTLAHDRGIECLILDYDAMRGLDDPHSRLF